MNYMSSLVELIVVVVSDGLREEGGMSGQSRQPIVGMGFVHALRAGRPAKGAVA
jgi:hypothetical protein